MIGERYPQALDHLRAALNAKSSMNTSWSALLEGGLVEERVSVDDDGAGHISVEADWPDGARDSLSKQFTTCLDELWECLDSLVVESARMFSVHQRMRAPEKPRFFPMADSEDGFQDLLAESCLDGILTNQAAMVADCQPFRGVHEDARFQRFRTGLRLLLHWTTRLAEGSKIGAWVTPVEPQLHVTAPLLLDHLDVASPGELGEYYDVAQFSLTGYEHGTEVSGQVGSYIDLGFPDGYEPAAADDTFAKSLDLVIDVVIRFVMSFEWLAGKFPGSRLLAASAEHTAAWSKASDSPRLWTDEELAGVTAADFGVGVVSDGDQPTLLVATENGVFERSIVAATPLNRYAPRGPAAERAAQDAAATWGLPDFVMSPLVERKGPGIREISDGLIVAGDRGLVIQVKSRDTEPRSTQKEASWLTKKIAEGGRQVDGTARRLAAKTTTMVNGRGRTVNLDGTAISWTGVIIIDHPKPPSHHELGELSTRVPTVVLLRRDWEFLFHQLRSSRAVINYLVRVKVSTELLGGEPTRYYELAAADANAEPVRLDPVNGVLGRQVSVPLLPAAPAGSDDNEAHGMVRIMCEDIANTRLESNDEADRLWVLASIDELPVGHRTELGRFLLDCLERARHVDEERAWWQFRTFRPMQGGAQLGFAICSKFDELTQNAFRSWLLLRHHERGTGSGELDTLTSIGVMLTPREDGYRQWDTTMVAVTGDPELADEELQASRELWNTGQ